MSKSHKCTGQDELEIAKTLEEFLILNGIWFRKIEVRKDKLDCIQFEISIKVK
jgi:hypothetical protein